MVESCYWCDRLWNRKSKLSHGSGECSQVSCHGIFTLFEIKSTCVIIEKKNSYVKIELLGFYHEPVTFLLGIFHCGCSVWFQHPPGHPPPSVLPTDVWSMQFTGIKYEPGTRARQSTLPPRTGQPKIKFWLYCCVHFVEVYLHFLIISQDFILKEKGLFILHHQCDGCWWPGDARSQSIGSHGIDVALSKYSDFSTRMVMQLCGKIPIALRWLSATL